MVEILILFLLLLLLLLLSSSSSLAFSVVDQTSTIYMYNSEYKFRPSREEENNANDRRDTADR